MFFCVNDFIYSSKGRQQTFGFIATATMISHCPLSKYVGCKSFIEKFSNRIVFFLIKL